MALLQIRSTSVRLNRQTYTESMDTIRQKKERVIYPITATKLRVKKLQLPQDLGEESGNEMDWFFYDSIGLSLCLFP